MPTGSSVQQTVSKGTASARTITRARILLKANAGPEGPEWTDTKIAEALEVGHATVERIRKRAVTDGVEAALTDRPRWENRSGKLSGEEEARLTALACSAPPQGRTRWTLHLLADHFSEQEDLPVSYGRNQTASRVNWRFTTADARIKLKRLYPSHQP